MREISLGSSARSSLELSQHLLPFLGEGNTFEIGETSQLPQQVIQELIESTQEVIAGAKLNTPETWQLFPYSVGRVIPEGYKVSENSTMLILLPGWGGTVKSTASILASLVAEAQKTMGVQTTMGVSLDSLVNENPKVNALQTSFEEHVANQAGVLLNEIEAFKTKKIILVAHSLAALESLEIILILQKMFEKRNLNAEVKAVTLVQVPGLYPQKLPQVIERTLQVGTKSAESRYVFPSPVDISLTKAAIADAREAGDDGKVLSLESELQSQLQKRRRAGLTISDKGRPNDVSSDYSNAQYPEAPTDGLPFLSKENWQSLIAIDQQLEQVIDKTQERELLKQRAELLKPVIEGFDQGNDHATNEKNERSFFEKIRQTYEQRNQWQTIMTKVRQLMLGQLNMVLDFSRLLKGIPTNILEQVKIPVGVAFAKDDLYYPASEAESEIGSEPFPSSSSRIDATIEHFPHIGPSMNPLKFATIVMDTVSKLLHTAGKQPDRVYQG